MRKTRWALILIALTAFLGGIFDPLFMEDRLVYARYNIGISILGAILMFSWYYFDSEEIAFRRTLLLNVMVVAIGIVAIPYYLFRSRGAKRGFIAFGLFLMVALVWYALVAGGYKIGSWMFA